MAGPLRQGSEVGSDAVFRAVDDVGRVAEVSGRHDVVAGPTQQHEILRRPIVLVRIEHQDGRTALDQPGSRSASDNCPPRWHCVAPAAPGDARGSRSGIPGTPSASESHRIRRPPRSRRCAQNCRPRAAGKIAHAFGPRSPQFGEHRLHQFAVAVGRFRLCLVSNHLRLMVVFLVEMPTSRTSGRAQNIHAAAKSFPDREQPSTGQ